MFAGGGFYLLKVFGIERKQILGHEQAVSANQLAVEIHLPAAVFGRLDAYQVPMDGAVVAIGAFVVAVAGGQVETAGDLFVKQGIPDGTGDVRVDAEGKLADIPRALVGVKDLVAARGVAADGLDDLPVF